MIGNKKDFDDKRDVSYEEASQFAEENGLIFLETSAKTGENVEEAVFKTAQMIYQNVLEGNVDLSQDGGVSKKPNPVIQDEEITEDKKKGCCG